MDSFREVAVALLARGGAFEVADAASLAVAAARLLTDPAARDRAARAARAFVEEHAGAAGRTLAALARLVPEVFA
jgi:3-deoxy-D-manno-octulosonic-acid transferase